MTTLSEYVARYQNEKTKVVRQAAIRSFLEYIYGKQRERKWTKKSDIKIFEDQSERYLREQRDFGSDLIGFATSLSSKPPFTAASKFNSVKGWLEYNDIQFTKRQLDDAKLKLPKGRSRTVEDDLDTVTIRKILVYADLKLKNLVLFLASSGCRLNEALSLELDDLKLNDSGIGVVTIRGEGTKTGETRMTFISSEAAELTREWLKMRSAYLQSAHFKGNGIGGKRPEPSNDKRVFPFTDQNAIQAWNLAVKKAGLARNDRTTNRRTIHIHMLRKYFRSQLALKTPVDIVEALMGHSAYLSDAYRRYSKTQIREFYEKGESALTIMGTGDISEVKEQLETTKQVLEQTRNGQAKQSDALSSVVLENTQLKNELAIMKEQIDTITTILQALTKSPTHKETLEKFKKK